MALRTYLSEFFPNLAEIKICSDKKCGDESLHVFGGAQTLKPVVLLHSRRLTKKPSFRAAGIIIFVQLW